MLKQVVQFTDYNDESAEETLYFNLSKMEMVDMLDLEPRIKAWAELTDGPERELTTDEVKELLAILKILIDLSYGVRSDDGKHFRKSSELLSDFKQSAAYDAFVMSMFENPVNAVNFMTHIVPKDLRDQVAGDTSATVVELPQLGQKKFEDYSEQELLELPQEEFERLIPKNPKDMSREQLMIAMNRRSKSKES